jgi:NTP pyrophosphatase (non-canonical NTP hydrolase)
MTAGDYSIGSRKWPGLAKLMEECGEAVQAGAKLIAANGADVHWQNDLSLTGQLEDEIADVTAAIVFLTENNPLDTDRITTRANRKLKLFRTWHAAETDHSNAEWP